MSLFGLILIVMRTIKPPLGKVFNFINSIYRMKIFPSTKLHKMTHNRITHFCSESDVISYCRQPKDELMAQCDKCGERFHKE